MANLSPREAAQLAGSLPAHVSKVTRLMERFQARTGYLLTVVPKTGGFRSEQQQAQIHADSVAARRQGAGYRAAPADRSKHTRGAATDLHIVPANKQQPRVTVGDAAKDAAHRLYKVMAEEARAVGLKPGLDFQGGDPDPYHVEEAETLEQLTVAHRAFVRGLLWQALAIVVGVAAVAAFVIPKLQRRKAP